MSEPAPQHDYDADKVEAVNRQFELITEDFFIGPQGPFFGQKWSQEIDISALLDRQVTVARPSEGDRLPIKNGRQLLLAIFDQVGLVEDSERINEYRQARNSMITSSEVEWSREDSRLFRMLDTIIRLNDATLPLVNDADERYRSAYWEDYRNKTGQNHEMLDKLYDKTEPFDECGLLKSLRTIRQAGFSQDVALEADRIARIMICKELDIEED